MTRTLSAAALLFLFSPLAADTKKASKKSDDKWTEDDILLAASASDFQVSPDGKWVVWVKTAQDEDEGEEVSHLWRTELATGKAIALTRGADSCHHPRWSPDGRHLAFLSARSPGKKKKKDKKKEDEEKAQVWLLDASGGEPWPLTESDRAVVALDWTDAGTVVYVAKEDPTHRESKEKEDDEDTSVVIEDEKNEPPMRLFKVEVEEKKTTRLTDNADRIQSIVVSPDGRWALATHARSLRYDYDNQIKPAYFLHDLKKGGSKQVLKDPKLNVQQVRWTRDSKGFYFSTHTTTHPRYLLAMMTEVCHFDLTSGSERKVDLDWERGLADPTLGGWTLDVAPDGFVALLADGVRHKAARYVRAGEGWKREWLTGEHAARLFALQTTPDGKTALYAESSAATPTRWFRATLDGPRLEKPRAIANLNAELRQKPHARVEGVRWKGAQGEETEGLLYYPQEYKKDKKYPLMVMIHGGPFGVDLDVYDESWAYPAHLMAQRGAFVFKPNYHGSSNYGLKFAESLAGGKYYDLPVSDIEAGVDALIARGLVDPDRVATMGWSNGAILSAALLTRSPRYKAAALGAGGAEWVGDWGACEFGHAFSNYYFGKSPLEDPQLYLRMAPLYQFDKIRAPVIIFQGDADRAVPPHHAWSQFRTLQAVGKAEVRLVMFPDEPHSLGKLVHQRRKLKEELAWFDRHFFKTVKDEDLSLKDDSPLALALARKKAKRDGMLYGIRTNGTLVPETVRFEALELGRFEVTAAQYAAFDKTYKVDPGKENYPAVGVSFEKAKAYCEWLGQQTGASYRLPDDDDAEDLYDDRDAEDENTLDHWAGYAVNPEDAARLRQKVKELGEPLLREVGRFKGAGKDDKVFDLGGNAAEWVETEDGKGRAAGRSAVSVADEKARPASPPEYTGFRVIKEAKK